MMIGRTTVIHTDVKPATTMRIEYRLEALKIRAPIAVKLEDYLKQNPSQFLYSGPISRAAASAGFRPGAPISFGQDLKLRPAGPIATDIAKSTEIPSPVAKAAQVASLMEAARGPLQEWAKTHSGFDTSLDVIGFFTTTPQAWNAMVKPGKKDKFELTFTTAQVAVSIGKVGADLFGMPHAKHALVWTGAILKMGEQIRAVIIKKTDETGEASTKARRPRTR